MGDHIGGQLVINHFLPHGHLSLILGAYQYFHAGTPDHLGYGLAKRLMIPFLPAFVEYVPFFIKGAAFPYFPIGGVAKPADTAEKALFFKIVLFHKSQRFFVIP